MDVREFVSDASFWTPEHLREPYSWIGHIPFAFWIVEATRPRIFVELGTHAGNSYFAFCQSVDLNGLETRCHAIDTWQGDAQAGFYDEQVYERVERINRERYSRFSKLIRSTFDNAACQFQNGEIDLLHIDGFHSYEAVKHDFETWLPKLSDQGVVLFHDTNVHQAGFGVDRFFHEVAQRYRTFNFLHSNGLGVALIGNAVPEVLSRLNLVGRDQVLTHRVRDIFDRLGSSVGDAAFLVENRRFTSELGASLASANEELIRAAGWLSDNAQEIRQVRSVLDEVGGYARRLEGSIGSIKEENSNLNERVAAISLDLDTVRFEKASLLDELTHIRGSLSWMLISKAKRVRAKLFRSGSRLDRGQAIFARLVRSIVRDGGRVTLHKVSSRVRSKMGISVVGVNVPGASDHFPNFEALPWRVASHLDQSLQRSEDRFQVLLVSHEATRTGAPLLLLQLAKELGKSKDLQCWIVMAKGGDLADSFASVCPTLDTEDLAIGYPDIHAPTLLAKLYRAGGRRGVALCSSAASGPYFAAFSQHGVPVLGWIHELNTVLEMVGGKQLAHIIARSARRLIVPTQCVREQLSLKYGLNAGQIEVIHYGVESKPAPLTSRDAREKIRKELELPIGAEIVLGCGSIEIRKGTDLFVQLGKRIMTQPRTPGRGHGPYFIWLGRTLDDGLKVWLHHDLAQAGFADRFRFVGQKDDPTPYFQAADVFVLPSREETFSLVCVEAMMQGVPVVAFRGAGGAPEILEGCGTMVDYLDMEAMAQTIIGLLESPENRMKQGLAAQSMNRGRFTWENFGERVRLILEKEYGFRPASTRTTPSKGPHLRASLSPETRSPADQTSRTG